jgi:hypothetical protein
MSNTLETPVTPADQAEVDYGNHLIWRLIGAKITMFGANATGEIFLAAERDGVVTEVIVGLEDGQIALFEVEKKDAAV